MPRDKSLAGELLLLLLLAFLWGGSYPLIKLAVAEIPPITLIAARVGIAAFVLLLALRWQGHRLPLDGATWRALLLQAVFNSIGAWTLLAWGQRFVPSSLAGVLNSTSPLFVFLATWLFTRHEATAPRRLLGALLGLAGVALVLGLGALSGLGRALLPQLAVLGGAVLYAGAAIHGRRFARLPPTVTAAGTMLWATACMLPASLALDRPWALAPSWTALGAAAFLGLFCTALALLLYFRLVCTLGSMGVASQSYLRAGIGALFGTLLLGEQLTPAIAAGLLLTILGVAAINLPARNGRRRRA
jgi:drug/metabolite transporter (DMT)-like permease